MTREMRWVPRTEITQPPKGAVVMVSVYQDFWWAVNDKDEVAFFATSKEPWSAPQCNLDYSIASTAIGITGAIGVVKIDHAFIPLNPRDY